MADSGLQMNVGCYRGRDLFSKGLGFLCRHDYCAVREFTKIISAVYLQPNAFSLAKYLNFSLALTKLPVSFSLDFVKTSNTHPRLPSRSSKRNG